MSNIIRKEIINNMNNYFKKLNKLSIFPIIDTDVISNLDDKLKNDNIDYDEDPVVCCAHCKKLSIKIDEDDNEFCILCKNSINETELHSTIFHYKNK